MAKQSDIDTLILNLHEIGCENRCIFCREHKKISKNLSDRIAAKELKKLEYLKKNKNVKALIISGNDPLEYYDFVNFLKKIKKKTNLKVFLQSHCNPFADKNYLRNILATGIIEKIQIPLYGQNGKIHDSVTKNNGSFKKVVKAIGNLRDLGFKNIELHTLFLRHNDKNLYSFFKFLSSFGYTIDASLPCLPSYKGVYDKNIKELIPDMGRVEEFFNRLKKNTKMAEKIFVHDMPLCLAKNVRTSFRNESAHKGYDHFKKEKIDTVREGEDIIASYRILKKSVKCRSCSNNSVCKGITKPYIDLKLFSAKPFSR